MLVSGYRLALGLTSFQRAAGRPLETLRGPVDPTQQQPSKPHFNFSLGQGIESHRPSSQTATDRNLCSLPIDLALLVDPPAIHPWIGEVFRGSGVGPCRALINVRGTFHSQRFMGTFTVELLPPQIQRGLLSGVRLKLLANIPVHSFMPAIVLRMSRTPPFQIYPQGQPPDRQPAQSKKCLRVRKGRTVIAADGPGQPITFKQPLKTQTHCLSPAVGQTPQLQNVTAVLIPHRQGFAALTRLIIPPALEVHRPYFVRRLAPALRPQPSRCHRSPPSLARLRHPGPGQHPLETAFRCPRPMHPQIQSPYLARSPMPMKLFEPHHLTNHLRTQLIGMPSRSARLLHQPLRPPMQQALPPLVARLGADAIFSTQRPKVVRAQRFHRKLNPLIHRFTRFPRHPGAYRSKTPFLSVTYVLNHPSHPCSEPAPISRIAANGEAVIAARCPYLPER